MLVTGLVGQALVRAGRTAAARPKHAVRTLVTGLVGMPNVGKSSLFNALTGTVDSAMVANYPFATIDPNNGVARVEVPGRVVLFAAL